MSRRRNQSGEHARRVRQREDGTSGTGSSVAGSALALGAGDVFELFDYPAQIVHALFSQATDAGVTRRQRTTGESVCGRNN